MENANGGIVCLNKWGASYLAATVPHYGQASSCDL